MNPYEEGFDAYFTHADNPYRSGSEEFRRWELGFDDAWDTDLDIYDEDVWEDDNE